MDELNKNLEEEKNITPEQTDDSPVTLNDDEAEKVAGGIVTADARYRF